MNYLKKFWTTINTIIMDYLTKSYKFFRSNCPSHLKSIFIFYSHFTKIRSFLYFTFVPVLEKLFPALPIVTVRSHIPGKVAFNLI